jgi:uncharacterized membrane protein
LLREMTRRWKQSDVASERGAVLPLVAGFMAVLVTSVSFGVDLGRLAAEKREVQSVVDLVALDAARLIDGRSAAEIYPIIEAGARESALRNDYVATDLKTMDVTLGVWNWKDRVFTPLSRTSLATPNAVNIGGASDVPFFFSSWDFKAIRGATAVRVLDKPPCDEPCDDVPPPGPECEVGAPECPLGSWGALKVGSTLLGFQGEVTTPIFIQQKIDYLNTILPVAVNTPTTKWNVTLAGYQGLAAADVTLDQLRVAGAFATVDALLSASVTYGQLMAITATALSSEPGGGASAQATGALGVAATATSTQQFKVGDLIKVQQGAGGSAAEAAINVANLVIDGAYMTASAKLASGGSALSAPIATAIPGVTTSTLNLAVVEPPAIAIGPAGQNSSGAWLTRAKTAQVRAQLDTVYSVSPSDALAIGSTTVSVPIVLAGAEATGVLRKIQCQPTEAATKTTIGADTGALNAYIGTTSNLKANPLVVNNATLVNQVLLTITGKSTVVAPGASSILSFSGPYDESNSQTLGGYPAVGVGTQLDYNLTTTPVASQAAMQGALLPYMLLLDDHVIKPMTSALGLQVGGARVTSFDVECGAPVLVK